MARPSLISSRTFRISRKRNCGGDGWPKRKRGRHKPESTRKSPPTLPTAVGRTFAGFLLAPAVHVNDAGLRLVRRHDAVVGDGNPGFARVGKGVHGQGLEIARIHEVLQRLGRFLLVERELVNHRSQCVEIVPQDGLSRPQNGRLIAGNCHRHQDDDDADDHHQFNQSESALSRAPLHIWFCQPSYHVLYFVPSSPVPSDLVYTSNTFCPPQESESRSSCIDRSPQSVVPVIGSTGICRKNRIFLPFESTPFTRVSRSGG